MHCEYLQVTECRTNIFKTFLRYKLKYMIIIQHDLCGFMVIFITFYTIISEIYIHSFGISF